VNKYFRGQISLIVDIVLKLHIQKQNTRIPSGVPVMRLCYTSLAPNTLRMCGNNNRNFHYTDLMSHTAQRKYFSFGLHGLSFCESPIAFYIHFVLVAFSFILGLH